MKTKGTNVRYFQNQAACMLIKENDETRKAEIAELRLKIEQLTENENNLKRSIQDLETEICDKNKVSKSTFILLLM